MQGIYIQVTRGVAPRDHAMPQGLTPTVFVMVNPMKPVADALRAKGVACVSAPTSAGRRPTSRPPACSARCWRGRSASRPAPPRPSCSATRGSARPPPATSGWSRTASCGPAQGPAGAGRHPLRPDRADLRRRRHPVHAAPHRARGGVRRRRTAAVLRQQGSPAGHDARRPHHRRRPPRPDLPGAVRRLPAGQGDAATRTSECPHDPSPRRPDRRPQGIADRVPLAISRSR